MQVWSLSTSVFQVAELVADFQQNKYCTREMVTTVGWKEDLARDQSTKSLLMPPELPYKYIHQ